jgi:hypothetical protein
MDEEEFVANRETEEEQTPGLGGPRQSVNQVVVMSEYINIFNKSLLAGRRIYAKNSAK